MSRKKVSVIVGTGLAGVTTAQTLRAEGFEGYVIVVGEEQGDPYDRPPLTKGYLRGEMSADEVALHPHSFYAEQDIELVAGKRITRLDVHAAEISLAGGGRISYDALLLATGAAPRPLRVPGADLDGVHLLRTLRDADALASGASSAEHVVVIGGGWIGAEATASLRQLGKNVTIVAPESVLLERVLGMRIGSVFSRLHAEHGVDLRLGRGITELRGTQRVESVVLDDATTIDCDLVVVGIGAVPRVELADEAGLYCSDGIVTDDRFRTNGSNVYAAGDVANAGHPRYGRLRTEHWANARDQGAAVARSMMGAEGLNDRIPYFFSDQYDLGMEFTGRPGPSDELVIRGDLESFEFIAFWLDEGRVTAGMHVNVWDVTSEIERLISSRKVVDVAMLADTDVPMSAAVCTGRVA
jgi:3-phenylpropionate/trans-cinnamate dioxygenase ferredoxin reductase subunit